ncbi:ABC transporter permease [Dietzia natronolimnaea]|uniref:ABC transporter permease n=1 Tax=Dietzia natronolimnaea TaxID=161920 RepID=A0A2A2WTS4_9ACTN|nr:ABC transporter permease [Dietzia natronolimnaea]PAY24622.1 ABC transporter permease [Dietzia natronolimnaea]
MRVGATMIELGPALAVAVVLFVVIGTAAAWLGRTGLEREVPWASIRAAVQLIALALVIGYVADRAWLVGVFVVVMATTASWAAAGRMARRGTPRGSMTGSAMTGSPRTWARGTRARVRDALWCALPVAVPPLVVVAGLLAAGVVRPNGLSVIPVVGIFLGNAMAIAGLAGRRAHDELEVRHGEVEAALSLGFTDYPARMMVCREAAATALSPSLDQTRTIGLVTIPGAFVGMILGGAEPWQAGVMQLFVSTGILACGAIALVVTTLLVAADRL